MAVTLNQGFAPYLLNHIKQVVGTDATPELKIENLGFLNFLQSQDKPRILRLNDRYQDSQLATVQIKYLQRWTPDFTQTVDTCAQTNQQGYQETSVGLNVFRQMAYYIDDTLIKNYTEDAAQMMQYGTPSTPIMGEFLTQLAAAANAIMTGINSDLQNDVVIGVNRMTGVNTSKTINITQNTSNLPLNDGVTEILTEYQENLGYGKPQVWGSGLFLNYMNQQKAKGLAQNGLMTKIEAGQLDFYYDQQASTILGSNQIIVAQPNSVQIVEYMRYKGPFSGYKGVSYFGTFMLPYQTTPNEVKMVEFDYQLKYFDCPTTLTNAYYGTTINVNRGWNMIVSKQCGLFQIPATAYTAIDPMFQNNGLLRYTITNI